MFQYYRVIFRELVFVTSLLLVIQLCYQQQQMKYLCNLASYVCHDSVETCRRVIIYKLVVIVLLLVISQKNMWRAYSSRHVEIHLPAARHVIFEDRNCFSSRVWYSSNFMFQKNAVNFSYLLLIFLAFHRVSSLRIKPIN